jgi:TonB-linked SusC/RagA family outer membrane protein
MRKVLTGLLFLLVAYCANAQDHTRKLTGVVKEQGKSTGIASATVSIKGSAKGGVTTDANGQFFITVPEGTVVLEFTSVGYVTKDVIVQEGSSTVEAFLSVETKELNSVVVTALGVKKSEKSISYATQQISNSDLTAVKTDNMMDALNGKVAGATISPSASGIGGSAKVILRGDRSAAGGNQPLYVIDGVPISNTGNNISASTTNMTGGPNSTYGGSTNADQGDGISNLNPDDIESITVLKGASAAALYGSQAANGVIVITTKKGKVGRTAINYSSSASTDHVAYLPKFQNEYGQTAAGQTQSWGPQLTGGAPDNLKAFFQNADNFTNSINLSGGSDVSQSYFSYANTAARGVEPTNTLARNNFDFREIGHYLDNRLTVDVNVNYITQKIHNSPFLGLYFNPLTGLYLFPRGMDITPYKNSYEGADGTNGVPTQNWPFNEDVQQNPWWILNRNPFNTNRNRILINASVKYDFTSWLSLQARGNEDRSADAIEQDLYAGTNPVNAQPNGQFYQTNSTQTQKYGDLLLNFTVPYTTKFKVDGLLGSSIMDNITSGTIVGPNVAGNYTSPGLAIPNLMVPQNLVVAAGSTNALALPANHNQIQSVFGNLNLSWDNWAYLTLTGRNDWSSNLSYTPNDSYFYPSAGLSVILSQLVRLPDAITYAKLRGSYAEVGNTVPNYVTAPLTHFGISGGEVLNSTAPFPTLKPEQTKSAEVGADLRFIQDRLSVSVTYYKTNTHNQFIQVTPSYSTTFATGYVNAGNIQNKGLEFMVGYDVVKMKHFTWNTSFNGSSNNNKIIDVDSRDGINTLILTASANNNYESVLSTGGSYGDIWGQTLVRNTKGQIEMQSATTPTVSSAFMKIGNPNPKFQLGWNNSFTYNKLIFSFLIDGKFGGSVLSMTQGMLDSYGVSKVSGDAREQGGVKINGVLSGGEAVTTVNAQTWYTIIGGRAGVAGEYIYSATVIRLREAALGYNLPFKTAYIKSLRLSLTARNLLYFSKKAPYDPELTMSTGNGLSGVDTFTQPATRNFGLSLSVGL